MIGMERHLTTRERENLLKAHRKERDKRVCDRIKAILLRDQGYSYSEIARILLLDDETIRRHNEDYFSKRKLKPENGGSESQLTPTDTEQLVAHLHEVTYLYVKDICLYTQKTFGIYYTVSGMTKWLHQNNFRYKKPHAVPAKADKERQEKFIKIYRKLKKKAADNEPIYFVDSVHPEHQTRLSYGWILKGERKYVATTARQRRLNIIGGICLSGHKIVHHSCDKVNAISINVFLKALRQKNPGDHKIHIILDNAAYHKSHEVKAYAKSMQIKLHYLPPYSPNLNPIERLWKVMHEHVTYNRYYEKFTDFTDATDQFFKIIGKKKRLLRSRITDNFQTLQGVAFAS